MKRVLLFTLLLLASCSKPAQDVIVPKHDPYQDQLAAAKAQRDRNLKDCNKLGPAAAVNCRADTEWLYQREIDVIK